VTVASPHARAYIDDQHQRKRDAMASNIPKPTTTDAGIPVASDEHSLTVGPDG
jgi:hypothetical protein